MAKSPSTQTTVSQSKSEPWSGQIPYLNQAFGLAGTAANKPMSFFPGQTYAGFSPETEAALKGQTDLATGGSDVMNASGANLTKTAQGDYLNAGNPYFSQMADRIRGEIQPNIEGRWAGTGGASAGMNRALGLGLGDAIGSLAYQNYGDERNRQMQTSLFAPSYENALFGRLGKLGEVGGIREDLAQQGINESMNRFNFDQMEPYQRAQLLMNIIGGNYGGTTEGTQTTTLPRRSPGSTALGGALSGAAMGGSALGPWGALGGGILGGLTGIIR